MSLARDQAHALFLALLDAFPLPGELHRFARSVADFTTMRTDTSANTCEDLISWADSRGALDTLLNAALAAQPNNAALLAAVQAINPALLPAATSQSAIRNPQPAIVGNPFEGRSTKMLGRERELNKVLEKLHTGNHCIIVGPEGSGKTLLLDQVIEALPVRLGWSHRDCVRINILTVTNLTDLQRAIVLELGGKQPNEWRSLWGMRKPRLLIIDDLGGMPRGERGIAIRVWLRGLTDTTHFLVTSTRPLAELFGNDPDTTSPFANALASFIELLPLPSNVCLHIVESRLAPFVLPSEPYLNLYGTSCQPKTLLRLCAERYEALTEG